MTLDISPLRWEGLRETLPLTSEATDSSVRAKLTHLPILQGFVMTGPRGNLKPGRKCSG